MVARGQNEQKETERGETSVQRELSQTTRLEQSMRYRPGCLQCWHSEAGSERTPVLGQPGHTDFVSKQKTPKVFFMAARMPGSRRGLQIPRTRVIDRCKPPCRCWKLNSRYLGRAASALNNQAISPAPNWHSLNFRNFCALLRLCHLWPLSTHG